VFALAKSSVRAALAASDDVAAQETKVSGKEAVVMIWLASFILGDDSERSLSCPNSSCSSPKYSQFFINDYRASFEGSFPFRTDRRYMTSG
jgi:hypothetical protein